MIVLISKFSLWCLDDSWSLEFQTTANTWHVRDDTKPDHSLVRCLYVVLLLSKERTKDEFGSSSAYQRWRHTLQAQCHPLRVLAWRVLDGLCAQRTRQPKIRGRQKGTGNSPRILYTSQGTLDTTRPNRLPSGKWLNEVYKFLKCSGIPRARVLRSTTSLVAFTNWYC